MKISPPNYLWINYCLLTGMMIPLSLNTVPFWLGRLMKPCGRFIILSGLFLCLISPKIGGEDHQHGKNLQASYNH